MIIFFSCLKETIMRKKLHGYDNVVIDFLVNSSYNIGTEFNDWSKRRPTQRVLSILLKALWCF